MVEQKAEYLVDLRAAWMADCLADPKAEYWAVYWVESLVELKAVMLDRKMAELMAG